MYLPTFMKTNWQVHLIVKSFLKKEKKRNPSNVNQYSIYGCLLCILSMYIYTVTVWASKTNWSPASLFCFLQFLILWRNEKFINNVHVNQFRYMALNHSYIISYTNIMYLNVPVIIKVHVQKARCHYSFSCEILLFLQKLLSFLMKHMLLKPTHW